MKKILALAILIGLGFSQAAENQLTPEEKKEGWKLLFDGVSTRGWRSFGKSTFPEKGWVVKDGILQLEPRSKAGDIITDQEFNDFDLRWEWRIPKGANNGVKYFITEKRREAIGHEYQMIDDATVKDPRQKNCLILRCASAENRRDTPSGGMESIRSPGAGKSRRALVEWEEGP